MKHLKVFESFNRSEFMSTEFSSQNSNKYDVDLENFPSKIKRSNPGISKEDAEELEGMGITDELDIQDHYLEVAKIEYDIEVYKDRAGIRDIDFIMKSVRINGTYDVWNEELDDTETFDFEIEDSGPFDGRVEFETEGFPIYPEDLVVRMNDSFDPKKFSYYVKLGR